VPIDEFGEGAIGSVLRVLAQQPQVFHDLPIIAAVNRNPTEISLKFGADVCRRHSFSDKPSCTSAQSLLTSAAIFLHAR
jgi:hypothetical protein